MRRPPTHTFDEGMKCIRCRREYARRVEVCDGPETADNRNLGALAKRNAYRERLEAAEGEPKP